MIIKAAFAGAAVGCGSCTGPADLERFVDEAQAEAGRAFGNPAVFVEKSYPCQAHRSPDPWG